MREIIQLKTRQRETLLDITSQVEQVVRNSGVRQGLVNVYGRTFFSVNSMGQGMIAVSSAASWRWTNE